jgi:hypothetical protein
LPLPFIHRGTSNGNNYAQYAPDDKQQFCGMGVTKPCEFPTTTLAIWGSR